MERCSNWAGRGRQGNKTSTGSQLKHSDSTREGGEVMSMLEVSNVSKSFGGIHALEECSVDVKQGSITGLIGPNGSGKTTLFNVITGYEAADGGEIRFDDNSITNLAPDKIFRLGIARTF